MFHYGHLRNQVTLRKGEKILILSSESTPIPASTQPPTQKVVGVVAAAAAAAAAVAVAAVSVAAAPSSVSKTKT
jgi:hypothetical protein